MCLFYVAGVAQLAEQGFRKSWAGGSIPLAGFFYVKRRIELR